MVGFISFSHLGGDVFGEVTPRGVLAIIPLQEEVAPKPCMSLFILADKQLMSLQQRCLADQYIIGFYIDYNFPAIYNIIIYRNA
jgi:hypothetical protein